MVDTRAAQVETLLAELKGGHALDDDNWGYFTIYGIWSNEAVPRHISLSTVDQLWRLLQKEQSGAALKRRIMIAALRAAVVAMSGGNLEECKEQLQALLDSLSASAYVHAATVYLIKSLGSVLCLLKRPLEAVELWRAKSPLVQERVNSEQPKLFLMSDAVDYMEQADRGCVQSSLVVLGPHTQERQDLALKAMDFGMTTPGFSDAVKVQAMFRACHQLLSSRVSQIIPIARRARSLASKLGVQEWYLNASFHVCQAQYEMGRLDEAEQSALALLEYMHEKGLKTKHLCEAYDTLRRVWAERGDVHRALQYAEKSAMLATAGVIAEATQSLLFIMPYADMLEQVGRTDEALIIDRETIQHEIAAWGPSVSRLAADNIAKGEREEAERILRRWAEKVRQNAGTTRVPFRNEKTVRDYARPLLALAELLEEKGTEEAATEAQELRRLADAASEMFESRQQEALREVRAAMATEEQRRREDDEEWVGGGGGGGGKRKGNKAKEKVKGKGKGQVKGRKGAGGKGGKDVNAGVGALTLREETSVREVDLGGVEIDSKKSTQRQSDHHAVADDEGAGAAEGEGEGANGTVTVGPDTDADDECPICLGDLDDSPADILSLGCRHRFHHRCLELWADKCTEKGISRTCPTCRRGMS